MWRWLIMKKVTLILSSALFMIFLFSNIALASTDFSGRQSSSFDLSNGKSVRIEYHGGQPHIHELDSKGNNLGSENINDSKAHHADGKKISKKTRDIVKNGKGKSGADKQAYKKAQDYGKEYQKIVDKSENAEKRLIEKNTKNIAKAANGGKFFVVLGGALYIVWWLVKLASGWGILLPV